MICDYVQKDGKWLCAMCQQPPTVDELEQRECQQQPATVQALPKRKGCNCGRRVKPR